VATGAIGPLEMLENLIRDNKVELLARKRTFAHVIVRIIGGRIRLEGKLSAPLWARCDFKDIE
jgi:hypothetical protein